MVDNGYILANGQFDDAKVAAGPNGSLGALYFAPDSFAFGAYIAQVWNENNPRIVPNANQLTVTAAAAVNGSAVTISGNAAPHRARRGWRERRSDRRVHHQGLG